ncbi:hypothetical protein D9M68_612290 [compost metagenome]
MYANRQARGRDGLLPDSGTLSQKKWVASGTARTAPGRIRGRYLVRFPAAGDGFTLKAGMTSLGVIVDSARCSLEKILSSRGKTLMADESNTETTETAPLAESAPPRKRRGPRPKNVVSDATAETPEAVAAPPVTDRSVESPAVAKNRGKKVAKGTGKTRGAKQTIETPAPVPVLDDIADLRQLEEENARLRKALAEKLRAENADLRKRLGLA